VRVAFVDTLYFVALYRRFIAAIRIDVIRLLLPAHEQGATIGVAQSAGSLARIVGPIFAATLLDYYAPLPYLICSAVSLFTALLVVQRLCREAQPVVPRHEADLAK